MLTPFSNLKLAPLAGAGLIVRVDWLAGEYYRRTRTRVLETLLVALSNSCVGLYALHSRAHFGG